MQQDLCCRALAAAQHSIEIPICLYVCFVGFVTFCWLTERLAGEPRIKGAIRWVPYRTGNTVKVLFVTAGVLFCLTCYALSEQLGGLKMLSELTLLELRVQNS